MLSCTRKVIEAAIAGKIARFLPRCSRKVGFKKELSPEITLTDVDEIFRGSNNRIATIDLSKAYEKVNRAMIMQECVTELGLQINAILAAFLQTLFVISKGNITGKVAELRLGDHKRSSTLPRTFCRINKRPSTILQDRNSARTTNGDKWKRGNIANGG